ncbi:serine/threonine-protein kinase [Synechocystis sp. LKSZ1]|uniref:serine/threonine-protein kinase n=1 Tax=Synechocystis sp. LKSZ1 TaxID=3144951 RepID=UPI00336C0160
MEILCTRPGCGRLNHFPDLDNRNTLQTAQQKFCTSCGMPLILAGRYLPVKLLGQGGFGAAFLALDRFTPTMRFCVVKQFQPAGDMTQEQRDLALSLFEREAAVLEKLGNRHDQIPDLYAFFPLVLDNPRSGKTEQFFYLVQEFIDGKNLEEELAQRGTFSEAEVRHVLTEMLKVLAFVHGKGSIHRDIKPSNIMRAKDGQLFLLDFGAVKQIASGAATPAASTGIYSMGFAPPEQMTGGQVYPATDLYALAVTCLYLLTGQTAQTLFDAYHNCWQWRNPQLKVSDDLAQVLDRLLLPTPRDRYQSAEEVLAALQGSISTPQPIPPAAPAPSTKLQATPAPAPAPAPTPAPVKTRPPQPSLLARISTSKVLLGAAFTGFEGLLIWLAATSLLPGPGLSMGVVGMALGGLIFSQSRRWIEALEMAIIAALTLIAFWFLPVLHRLPVVALIQAPLATVNPFFQNPFFVVLAMALFMAFGLIAITALFLLIYKLLTYLLQGR